MIWHYKWPQILLEVSAKKRVYDRGNNNQNNKTTTATSTVIPSHASHRIDLGLWVGIAEFRGVLGRDSMGGYPPKIIWIWNENESKIDATIWGPKHKESQECPI